MSDTLKTVLNVQLASEASSTVNLPYILQVLSPNYFSSSPHLSKWVLRVNSLLHSKDPGAKWSGLCLARATALNCRQLMIENAQMWLQVAIPLLSKKEPPPVLTAALNLCRIIFTSATDIPEFQRQVSTPNIPKFLAALIQHLENANDDLEFKALVLKTITRLVPIYPNIHRASHGGLSAITLNMLFDAPSQSTKVLGDYAAELHAVLHLTGGRVGAATLWRKSMDERLADAWAAFGRLRTSFSDGQAPTPDPTLHPSVSVTLNLARLRSSIVLLSHLLKSPTSRPVQVPIGPLVKFAMTLLAVTVEEQTEDDVVSSVRDMEMTAIPSIRKLACEFTICLAKCITDHLTPYLTRLCTYIAFQLEQRLNSSERHSFLEALNALLTRCLPLSSTVVSTRLTRTVLSIVKVILPPQTDTGQPTDTHMGTSTSKRGKKRARGYEGDEVFKTSMSVICPSLLEAKVLLEACDVLHTLLRNPNVSSNMHSLSCRVVLAAILNLPRIPPLLVSPDAQVHRQLVERLQQLALTLSEGTTSAMGRSLGLVMHALSTVDIDEDTMHGLDLLLHPRLPPLLRSQPQVEALSLFRSEESEEEAVERQRLGLEIQIQDPSELAASSGNGDVVMRDAPPPETMAVSGASTALPHPTTTEPPATTPDAEISSPALQIPDIQIGVRSTVVPQPGDNVKISAVSVSTPVAKHMEAQALRLPVENQLVSQTPQEREDEHMPPIDIDSDSGSE
ncbi:hypothetical protein E1B28_004173 [Marasmius oreades]|uniref:Pre-rRNA-processing protein RIX1 n=1 Tax=Marasmius oreades TaxID=181124 RepID=A0A9P8AC37_9AGAR|nr:uncharacterized protein E1B28_004173 [Marasmius oreades]KAG7096761.1 hypothetical protein E1B28_004173 [Marasmius oreades]